jgi:hypothetical protein
MAATARPEGLVDGRGDADDRAAQGTATVVSPNGVSQRSLSMDECRRLMEAVTGRDHLILRILMQLGLRPEELFGLRHNDVIGDSLRIDEAIVEMQPAETKTRASDASVYMPPYLELELRTFIQAEPGEPNDWLFHPYKSRTCNLERPLNSNNYRERVLQPAAIRAGVGVYQRKNKKGETLTATDVDFRVLHRTCATLFGDILQGSEEHAAATAPCQSQRDLEALPEGGAGEREGRGAEI